MANNAPQSTTQEKADAYDSFYDVFSHLYRELKALGSKKPSETLGASKVSIVNRLLQDILRQITSGLPSGSDFVGSISERLRLTRRRHSWSYLNFRF